jgi:superfamily II DNA or RNA helicase
MYKPHVPSRKPVYKRPSKPLSKPKKLSKIKPALNQKPEWKKPSKPKTPQRVRKDCIARSKISLLPHQREVVEWLNHNRGILAVHTTGSGKTLTAVTASQCFLDQYPGQRVVVISPHTLVVNFEKEMKRYGGMIHSKRYDFYSFEQLTDMSPTERESICQGNMLVIDEAHHLAGNRPYIGGIVKSMKQAQRVLLLTATPYIHQPNDISSLISIVQGVSWIRPEDFVVNVDSLKGFVHHYAVEKTRANGYPEVIMHERFFSMSSEGYENYKRIESNLLRHEYHDDKDRWLNSVRRKLLEPFDPIKVKYAVQKIQETVQTPSEKIVIYTNHPKEIEYITRALHELKIPYVKDMSRRENVVQYNSGRVRVFLLSRSGGMGLSLRETTRMLILDIPWNPSTLQQIVGRVARYKSHSELPVAQQKVDIYLLYLKKPSRMNPVSWEKWDFKSSRSIEMPAVDMITRAINKKSLKEEEHFIKWIQKASEKVFGKLSKTSKSPRIIPPGPTEEPTGPIELSAPRAQTPKPTSPPKSSSPSRFVPGVVKSTKQRCKKCLAGQKCAHRGQPGHLKL